MNRLIEIIECFDVFRLNLLLIVFLTVSRFSFSQVDYQMTLSNGVKVNTNTIEFDVLIKSLNNNFTLTSYQCSFLFNHEIANGGQLSFNYVNGSSQLSNLPSFAVGINNNDGEYKLTFASMAGSDLITPTEIVVGKFRLQNSISLSNIDPNIRWCFGGFVTTILTGENFQNITSSANHTSNLALSENSASNSLPHSYKLLQNYPNPFNPSTTIRIELPEQGKVNLSVFNILGEKVGELADETYDAGVYSFEFTSKELSSGTYFCKFEVDNKYVEITKMILVK